VEGKLDLRDLGYFCAKRDSRTRKQGGREMHRNCELGNLKMDCAGEIDGGDRVKEAMGRSTVGD
jgi:hypothetical protein